MATRSANDTEDRSQETAEEAVKAPGYDFTQEAELAYVNARMARLSLSVEKQERDLRQFKLLLVIVAYALVFGYLVGRNDARDSRS